MSCPLSLSFLSLFPDPYAVDGDEPRCDEFERGRPPEFEVDEETQLKVPTSPPSQQQQRE